MWVSSHLPVGLTVVVGLGLTVPPVGAEQLYSLLIFIRSVELKPSRWPSVQAPGLIAFMVGLRF